MGLDMYLFKRNLNKPKEDTIDVGYWRKANQIHNWFVENVQNGVDDCGEYTVSPSQLKELLEICKQIHETKDPKIAKTLLPTTEGFFFGSTDYDEDYFYDIKETITILTNVLEKNRLQYRRNRLRLLLVIRKESHGKHLIRHRNSHT